ncbi:MAG: iron donor protein CyaY [Betaproteobacteria bacterium TMED82]|nr:MAG: iron donor protein CyaY [Betaproteobacteria bacterium TMED82]|tara:strand:+ start:4890 stop:5231 length:342 start_codon:yes stop_codon:yes gene_type:complete
MEETLFLEKIQNTFTRIEAIVDKWNIDYDLVIEINKEANVLEIEFENQKKIILNAQTPMRQLWMASELGAYHFSFDEKGWKNTRGSGFFKDIFLRDAVILSEIKFSLEGLIVD